MDGPEECDYWRAKKAERRARVKAAAAAQREALDLEWAQLSEKERAQRKEEAAAAHSQRRAAEAHAAELTASRLADESLPVIVFDLSFSWCMTEADCRSTVAQIKFAYSALRRHSFPMRPVLTSAGSAAAGEGREAAAGSGEAQRRILAGLRDFEGFRRYPPQFSDAHWSELYDAARVVYLTADTDVVLESIEPDTVYIVGAFVDHNARKFLTRDAAKQYGVRTARLPITESIDLGNRCKILTVNHVLDVLCLYAETRDWRLAFGALPTRRLKSRQEKRSRGLSSAPSGKTSELTEPEEQTEEQTDEQTK